MKKIILLICATTLFVACSSSSDDAPVPTPTPPTPPTQSTDVLLSRFETTRYGNYFENFTYNGNKLVKTNRPGNVEVKFTYTGNLITLSENFKNNVLATNVVSTYDFANEKISETFQTDFFATSAKRLKTKLFFPNSQGITEFQLLDVNSSGGETLKATGSLTIVNGNLIKYTYTSIEYNEVVNYTYDTKKNARRNITGFNNILLLSEELSLNNVLTTNEIRNNTSGGTPTQTITNTNFTYIYNSNNYPVSSTGSETVNGGTATAFTTNYFY